MDVLDCAAEHMTYTVTSHVVGRIEVPAPQVFWMSRWDEWFELWFQVLVVRGAGVTLLVNTGLPPDLTSLNDRIERRVGKRGLIERTSEQRIESVLEAVDLDPEEVTHVICSPLTRYATGNLGLFPNAELAFSQRGWVHFHTLDTQHPHDSRESSFDTETLKLLIADWWPRVRLLNDEDEIAPGIRTWWIGAHHRSSLAVEIDTLRGTVVASDAFFCFENVEEMIPIGMCESIEEVMTGYRRITSAADLLVPLYDPKVFDRYGDGVVADG